jgi:hypothetical protein
VNVHNRSAAGTTKRNRAVIGSPTIGNATSRITAEIASVNRFATGAINGSTARGKNTLSVRSDASTIAVVDVATDADRYNHGTMPASTKPA